jgi:hypothetical protein
MIAATRPTEIKDATGMDALMELVIRNSYANFSMPNDPARRHCMARYDSPTKRPAEESKKRRKMAAKSRKINRKGK